MIIFIEFLFNFLKNIKILECKNGLFYFKYQFLAVIFAAHLTANIAAPWTLRPGAAAPLAPPLSTLWH